MSVTEPAVPWHALFVRAEVRNLNMDIPFYQVDAFARRVFSGNPAAVCPLHEWLDDAVLQGIALENNLAETAFFVREGDGFHLRWFTPTTEVDLCGHATLASAYVLMNELEPGRTDVSFRSRSGELRVTREGDIYSLDFPSRPPNRIAAPAAVLEALGIEPEEVLKARDFLCVFKSETRVRALAPNMTKLAALDAFAVIVTAKGDHVDFVSRFFAPARGVPEDPVTGSAHCTLIPYWSQILGKKSMIAHQVSARGGELICEDRGDRVRIAGPAVLFATGIIHLEEL
jgi:PhzF family phenazine biosynthesis protein